MGDNSSERLRVSVLSSCKLSKTLVAVVADDSSETAEAGEMKKLVNL